MKFKYFDTESEMVTVHVLICVLVRVLSFLDTGKIIMSLLYYVL
jgi:hypothetical protein